MPYQTLSKPAAAVSASDSNIRAPRIGNTSEGATGPLAAPWHCPGPHQYREVIRWRLANDPDAHAQLIDLARRLDGNSGRIALPIIGPFATEAREILTWVRDNHLETAP